MKYEKKAVVGAIFWLYVFAFAIIAITYRGKSLSADPGDWGAFADYVGGFINPLIGVGNLAALVYISFLIDDNDHKRHESEMQMQRDVALRGLQHQAIKDLLAVFNPLQNSHILLSDLEQAPKVVRYITIDFYVFIQTNGYLFNNLKTYNRKPISTKLDSLSAKFEDLNSKLLEVKKNGGNSKAIFEEISEELPTLITDIVLMRSELIELLTVEIVGEEPGATSV